MSSMVVLLGVGVATFVAITVVAVIVSLIRQRSGGGGSSVYSVAFFAPVLASLSLDIDLSPMFDSMNTYLPTFMALFGLIGGIVAAMSFSRFIVGIVTRALSGQTSF